MAGNNAHTIHPPYSGNMTAPTTASATRGQMGIVTPWHEIHPFEDRANPSYECLRQHYENLFLFDRPGGHEHLFERYRQDRDRVDLAVLLLVGEVQPPATGGFHPPPQPEETFPGNTTVFIGGLVCNTHPELLKSIFLVFGPIEYVSLPDRKNCAFVRYRIKHSAEMAIEKMQGFRLERCTIRLAWGKIPAGQEHHDRPGATIQHEAFTRLLQVLPAKNWIAVEKAIDTVFAGNVNQFRDTLRCVVQLMQLTADMDQNHSRDATVTLRTAHDRTQGVPSTKERVLPELNAEARPFHARADRTQTAHAQVDHSHLEDNHRGNASSHSGYRYASETRSMAIHPAPVDKYERTSISSGASFSSNNASGGELTTPETTHDDLYPVVFMPMDFQAHENESAVKASNSVSPTRRANGAAHLLPSSTGGTMKQHKEKRFEHMGDLSSAFESQVRVGASTHSLNYSRDYHQSPRRSAQSYVDRPVGIASRSVANIWETSADEMIAQRGRSRASIGAQYHPGHSYHWSQPAAPIGHRPN